MTEDDYDLDNIIKNRFEEAIEYFNKNGIKVEGLKLRIVKSIWSLFYRFIYFFLILLLIDVIAILYYATNIQIEYSLIESIIASFIIAILLLRLYQVTPGFIFS